MSKGSSSKNWRRRQDSDEFVKRAQAEGWRSRAVFKLMEIQERDRLIRRGSRVLDLGAAPGAWSQYASKIVGPEGRVIAVDLLEMDQIPGVDVIQGDFRDEKILEDVLQCIGTDRFDLVMSDMSPNISGMKSVDQPRAMYLAELALAFAIEWLKPGGDFLVKAFQGEGIDDYLRQCREAFDKVMIKKPKASRPRSREIYILGRGRKLQ